MFTNQRQEVSRLPLRSRWPVGNVALCGFPGENECCVCAFSCSVFKYSLFLRAVLGSQQYRIEGSEVSIDILTPPIHSSPLHHQHAPPEWYTFTTDEPILMHHYFPKSIVYIKFHSWSCTFYGLQKIVYKDVYPPYRVFSLPWKSFLLCSFIRPSPQPLATHWSF